MADGTDGADAFSSLVAYARAWGVKQKKASAPSAASGAAYLVGTKLRGANRGRTPGDEGTHHARAIQVPTTRELMDAIGYDSPHIVIEMPDKLDCRSIGTWLLKAAEAQSFLSESLRDPAFMDSASALCWWCEPGLDCAALEALAALPKSDPPFHSYKADYVLAVDLEFGESGMFGTEFAIMVQLGFFLPVGRYYRLTLPESVTLEKVQQAALIVAATAKLDGDGLEDAQPERLLQTMPQAEAEAWRSWLIQKRLFDDGELGVVLSIAGTRLALPQAPFRMRKQLSLGDKWARWGAIVQTGRSGLGPSGTGDHGG